MLAYYSSCSSLNITGWSIQVIWWKLFFYFLFIYLFFFFNFIFFFFCWKRFIYCCLEWTYYWIYITYCVKDLFQNNYLCFLLKSRKLCCRMCSKTYCIISWMPELKLHQIHWVSSKPLWSCRSSDHGFLLILRCMGSMGSFVFLVLTHCHIFIVGISAHRMLIIQFQMVSIASQLLHNQPNGRGCGTHPFQSNRTLT